jgi:hypothetical protein
LTGILSRPEEHSKAITLFLEQHRWLYASGRVSSGQPTYEDNILSGLLEQTFRAYPARTSVSKNSIAWHLWHCARIEDITMNVLISGQEQVLHSEGYAHKLQIRFLHTGNGMDEEEIAELSRSISIHALSEYRQAVAEQTRSIIPALTSSRLRDKVSPERIRQVSGQGAVKASEQWLLDYWAGKTLAGLVLMPATRHNFLHLNKAMHVKLKLQE